MALGRRFTFSSPTAHLHLTYIHPTSHHVHLSFAIGQEQEDGKGVQEIFIKEGRKHQTMGSWSMGGVLGNQNNLIQQHVKVRIGNASLRVLRPSLGSRRLANYVGKDYSEDYSDRIDLWRDVAYNHNITSTTFWRAGRGSCESTWAADHFPNRVSCWEG